MRIDKLLWYLRLARSRAAAQDMAVAGHLRLNGRRVERAHQPTAPGDVLTLPRGNIALVIEVLSLPARRGPAPEAQSCYRVLDGAAGLPLAAARFNAHTKEDLQP